MFALGAQEYSKCVSNPGKEGLSTGPLTVTGTAVRGSLPGSPNVSTAAIDVCSRQTGREWGKRGRKTFCIITTFRKEHALKGNIFSKALGCLLHTEYLASLCVSPSSFPFLSLTPHTSRKLLAKRPAFLIALNYRDVGFFLLLIYLGLTTGAG